MSRCAPLVFALIHLAPTGAQTLVSGTQINNPLTPVAVLPATCQPYSVFYLTTTHTPYVCTSATVLTPISGLPAETGTPGYLYTDGRSVYWGNIQTGGSGALDCTSTPGRCDVTAIVPLKNSANAWTGSNDFHSGTIRLPESTVSSLPAAAAVAGVEFVVTDGANNCDTSSGGGSTRVLVESNGSAWVAPNCSAGSAGAGNAVQVANGAGGFADSGCTASSDGLTCSSGFSSGGPFAITGQHQSAASLASPPSTENSLVFDSGNADHLVRKDSSGRIHDLEIVIVGGYEIGSENAIPVLATADLSNHGAVLNSSVAKTLTEASCVSDSGSQAITASVGGSTLFTITCVAPVNYSVSPSDGSSGYIQAASMSLTALAANARIDLSGTANGVTKDIKLFIYGAF